jgi:FkbM family methyltransferase
MNFPSLPLRRLASRLINKLRGSQCVSFSGHGEDAIILAWLRALGFDPRAVRYLDIGAAEPRRLSNTYLLYSLGARGVLVEPDPDQAATLRMRRPRDAVLQVGAAFDERRRAPLTRMRHRVFNSFLPGQIETILRDSAKWGARRSQSVVDTIDVALVPINEIIEKHMQGRAPDLLSIDAEGCDFEILRTLDLTRYRPSIITMEASKPAAEVLSILGPFGYELVFRGAGDLTFLRDHRHCAE